MSVKIYNTKLVRKQIKDFDEKVAKLIPASMQNMDVKVVCINSKWDTIRPTFVAIKEMFQNMYVGCGFEDLSCYLNRTPPITNTIYGVHMNAKGDNGEHLIYLYIKNIKALCKRYDSDFEGTTLIALLHELYHAFQNEYWVGYDELNEDYMNNAVAGEDSYRNHILEVTARKWSMSRIEYCFGDRYKES